jgi:pimeloyl-ACP methyl ester carboxylesterase
MADWPLDVAGLADALDRFIVSGHSSGGPCTVACAALLAERVSGGIVFGGVTDMAWPSAWDGYIESERRLMSLGDEAAAVAWCEQLYDGAIPLARSRHTAELIRGSRLRIVPGHGHMTTLSLLPAPASGLVHAQS